MNFNTACLIEQSIVEPLIFKCWIHDKKNLETVAKEKLPVYILQSICNKIVSYSKRKTES